MNNTEIPLDAFAVIEAHLVRYPLAARPGILTRFDVADLWDDSRTAWLTAFAAEPVGGPLKLRFATIFAEAAKRLEELDPSLEVLLRDGSPLAIAEAPLQGDPEDETLLPLHITTPALRFELAAMAKRPTSSSPTTSSREDRSNPDEDTLPTDRLAIGRRVLPFLDTPGQSRRK